MLEGLFHLFAHRSIGLIVTDAVDILVVTYVVYRALLVLRGTRAMQMGIGIGVIFLVYVISSGRVDATCSTCSMLFFRHSFSSWSSFFRTIYAADSCALARARSLVDCLGNRNLASLTRSWPRRPNSRVIASVRSSHLNRTPISTNSSSVKELSSTQRLRESFLSVCFCLTA